MQIIKSREELKRFILQHKKSKNTIGFAPTMGALHSGHISLYEVARTENDVVVSSIFVNPTQFNNPDDLEKYPRTLENDLQTLETSGFVDAVYLPEIKDLYPNGAVSRQYNFEGIEMEMEGASRPGHFDGVGTVVEELFRQVQPDNAYFGEKDFQQLAIIKKLTEITQLSVKIHGVPTARETDGVAMSSRNKRLTEHGRKTAEIIPDTLFKVQQWFGKLSIPEINQKVKEIFENKPEIRMEYFTIADEQTLRKVDIIQKDHQYRAFLVVVIGDVRLIDNMQLSHNL